MPLFHSGRGVPGTIVSRHRLCEDEAGRLSIDKAEDLVASAVSWPSGIWMSYVIWELNSQPPFGENSEG